MGKFFFAFIASCIAFACQAKLIWLAPEGGPFDRKAVLAEVLRQTPGESGSILTYGRSLLSWTFEYDKTNSRVRSLQTATTLLITVSEGDPDGFNMLAVATLRERNPTLPIVLVSEQKPIYKMNGLCNNKRLQRNARIALQVPNIKFAALPKAWQRAYTDDNFYEDRIPRCATAEQFVMASALILTIYGKDAKLTPHAIYGESNNKALIKSIRKGLALTDDVLYAADRMASAAIDIRRANDFKAVLFDGTFEHVIGDKLLELAKADGRKLELLYTTETTIKTGLPALFRTTQPIAKETEATLYTRPAFEDNTGLTEIDHLDEILSKDAGHKGYIAFPIALSRFIEKHPRVQIYDGAKPCDVTASLYAAMLYLQWTGSIAFPNKLSSLERDALELGYLTQMQLVTAKYHCNAVLFRLLGHRFVQFSLWHAPADKVQLRLAMTDPTQEPDSEALTFSARDYDQWQSVTIRAVETSEDDFPLHREISADKPLLLWKINDPFPGQNTGAREISIHSDNTKNQ